MIKLLFVLLVLVLYTPVVSATKKHCQPYLDKLNNIQSKQRAGYSAKQGIKLAERERKAREKWWQCQTGKIKAKKKRSDTQSAENNTTHVKNAKITFDVNTIEPLTSKLHIKAKFQGEMQQAWLAYYQPKQGCRRPKSLNVFAKCVEDELQQAKRFAQQYNVQPNK